MKFRSGVIAMVVATALTAAHVSFAQFPTLPKAPSLPSTSSSGSSADTSNLSAQQDQIVKAYVVADTEALKGQSKLAEALGLKDEAAKIDAEVKALNSGATESSDDLKKADTVINDAQPQIDAKSKQQQALSSESKKTYVEGLEHLGIGTFDTYKLKDNAVTFGKSVQDMLTKAPLQQKTALTNKFSAGSYVASHALGHATALGRGLSNSVSFAQNHGIPVPKSATDVLHQNAVASN